MILKDIILPFDGLHANIPSGFVRETLLDGRFPKAWGSENVSTTGGASTHSHTEGGHSHAMVNHTHTYTLTQHSGNIQDNGYGNSGSVESDEVHTHSGTSGNVSGGTLSGTATIGSASNNPPYYEVIFIKSQGFNSVPANALMLRNDTLEPDGFHFCDGDNGTPNLDGKYLRGAAASGNAGATGGSLTHSHSIDHGHTSVNHSHSGALSGQATNGQGGENPGSEGQAAAHAHRHTVTLNSTSTSVNTYSGSFTSGNVEPVYHTLRANKNTSGNSKSPRKGDIALWLGDPNDIPVGWDLCDGNNGTPNLSDKYIKISSTPGNTGGGNTHGHTSVGSHTHTATGSHTHTGSTGGPNDTSNPAGNGHSHSNSVHTHPVSSVQSVTPTWESSTIDTDTVSNEPLYRTAVYVMYQFSSAPLPPPDLL